MNFRTIENFRLKDWEKIDKLIIDWEPDLFLSADWTYKTVIWPWFWDMLKSENLYWLTDYSEARDNLSVYSETEVNNIISNLDFAATEHTHEIDDISWLQDELNSKADLDWATFTWDISADNLSWINTWDQNAEWVEYDNTTSWLTAIDIQSAIDELWSEKANKNTTITINWDAQDLDWNLDFNVAWQNLTKSWLIAGEAMSALQVYHNYKYWNQTVATTKKIYRKVAFKNFKWSWISWNTFTTFLSKTWTPTVDLKYRLETDNAGKPSWTLIDVNAYWSISQASLTTSLVQTTCTLNWSITTSLNNIWLVLETDTADSTNYYNIWVWTWDEFSSYIYDWSDWVNEWTWLNETFWAYGWTYTNTTLTVEYFFTPSVNWILKTSSWRQWQSMELIRVSDSVVIWNWSFSASTYTFNLPVQSWVQYKLKHMSSSTYATVERWNNGTLTVPSIKTNFTLNSVFLNWAPMSSNRREQISAIQIAPNSTTIKNENININTNIFQLDLNRISKANDTLRLKVDWIVNNNVIQYWDFSWSFEWIIWWFTWLIWWDILTSTGFNVTQWTWATYYTDLNAWVAQPPIWQKFTPTNKIKLTNIQAYTNNSTIRTYRIDLFQWWTKISESVNTSVNVSSEWYVTFNFTNNIILNSWVEYEFRLIYISSSSPNYWNWAYNTTSLIWWNMTLWWVDQAWDMRYILNWFVVLSSQIWDLIYLQDDGTIWLIPWTNKLVVWKIFSNTEIELSQRINWETSITATTWSVVPWNAQWYITINIPWLGNKKIPYWGV